MLKKVKIIMIIILFMLTLNVTNSEASNTEKSIVFADKEFYFLVKENLQKNKRETIISYNDNENSIVADITKIDSLFLLVLKEIK